MTSFWEYLLKNSSWLMVWLFGIILI